jgi:hypothetical protein
VRKWRSAVKDERGVLDIVGEIPVDIDGVLVFDGVLLL